MSNNDLITKWGSDIYMNISKYDTEDEHDWYSVAYGYAIANGLNHDDATDFSNEVSKQNLL